jgi:hypothetical protein
MLSKKLSTVSVLVISSLVWALPSPSWSMEEEALPQEITTEIVRNLRTCPKTVITYNFRPDKQLHEMVSTQVLSTDWPTLCDLRLVSKNWKEITDYVIKEDKLLHLPFTAANSHDERWNGLSPLVTELYLAGWRSGSLPTNSVDRFWIGTADVPAPTQKKIGEDLSLYSFPSVQLIKCYSVGAVTQLCRFDTEDTMSLILALKKFPQLRALEFSIPIGAEGGKALGQELQHLTTLETLTLWFADMGPMGTKTFAKGLNHLKNLIFLDMNDNNSGDLGNYSVIKQLKNLPKLKHLSLNNTHCSEQVTEEILKRVKQHESLETYSGPGGPYKKEEGKESNDVSS